MFKPKSLETSALQAVFENAECFNDFKLAHVIQLLKKQHILLLEKEEQLGLLTDDYHAQILAHLYYCGEEIIAKFYTKEYMDNIKIVPLLKKIDFFNLSDAPPDIIASKKKFFPVFYEILKSQIKEQSLDEIFSPNNHFYFSKYILQVIEFGNSQDLKNAFSLFPTKKMERKKILTELLNEYSYRTHFPTKNLEILFNLFIEEGFGKDLIKKFLNDKGKNESNTYFVMRHRNNFRLLKNLLITYKKFPVSDIEDLFSKIVKAIPACAEPDSPFHRRAKYYSQEKIITLFELFDLLEPDKQALFVKNSLKERFNPLSESTLLDNLLYLYIIRDATKIEYLRDLLKLISHQEKPSELINKNYHAITFIIFNCWNHDDDTDHKTLQDLIQIFEEQELSSKLADSFLKRMPLLQKSSSHPSPSPIEILFSKNPSPEILQELLVFFKKNGKFSELQTELSRIESEYPFDNTPPQAALKYFEVEPKEPTHHLEALTRNLFEFDHINEITKSPQKLKQLIQLVRKKGQLDQLIANLLKNKKDSALSYLEHILMNAIYNPSPVEHLKILSNLFKSEDQTSVLFEILWNREDKTHPLIWYYLSSENSFNYFPFFIDLFSENEKTQEFINMLFEDRCINEIILRIKPHADMTTSLKQLIQFLEAHNRTSEFVEKLLERTFQNSNTSIIQQLIKLSPPTLIEIINLFEKQGKSSELMIELTCTHEKYSLDDLINILKKHPPAILQRLSSLFQAHNKLFLITSQLVNEPISKKIDDFPAPFVIELFREKPLRQEPKLRNCFQISSPRNIILAILKKQLNIHEVKKFLNLKTTPESMHSILLNPKIAGVEEIMKFGNNHMMNEMFYLFKEEHALPKLLKRILKKRLIETFLKRKFYSSDALNPLLTLEKYFKTLKKENTFWQELNKIARQKLPEQKKQIVQENLLQFLQERTAERSKAAKTKLSTKATQKQIIQLIRNLPKGKNAIILRKSPPLPTEFLNSRKKVSISLWQRFSLWRKRHAPREQQGRQQETKSDALQLVPITPRNK